MFITLLPFELNYLDEYFFPGKPWSFSLDKSKSRKLPSLIYARMREEMADFFGGIRVNRTGSVLARASSHLPGLALVGNLDVV